MSVGAWHAVILAAGRGRRLRPLTDRVPKCLVEIGGRPLLEWQLQALRAAGIHDLSVVGGYRARQLRSAGVAVLTNPDWRRSTMLASLLVARDRLRAGPCIVAYGDIAFGRRVVAGLMRTDADVAIVYDRDWRVLWEARFARPQDDAESLRVVNGAVAAIGAPIHDLSEADGQYIGLVRFTPSGWRRTERLLARLGARRVRTLETTHLLAYLVAEGERIAAVPIRGGWCEVDTPGDVKLYEDRLAAGGRWSHDWRSGVG